MKLPTLTLGLPPNRGNRRTHWAKEKRGKDLYRSGTNIRVAQWIGDNRLTRHAVTFPLTTPDLHWVVYTHQKMDEDNLWARLKWPLDALVRSGVIADDDPSSLGVQIVENKIDRKNPRIELTLTSLEGHCEVDTR